MKIELISTKAEIYPPKQTPPQVQDSESAEFLTHDYYYILLFDPVCDDDYDDDCQVELEYGNQTNKFIMTIKLKDRFHVNSMNCI
ncbi:hypothetical protein ABPG74_010005 [Tetrahymena malaccensis]